MWRLVKDVVFFLSCKIVYQVQQIAVSWARCCCLIRKQKEWNILKRETVKYSIEEEKTSDKW
jgi:hypothetical protein